MEEDILNYSPTVMFRGTPCNTFTIVGKHECKETNIMNSVKSQFFVGPPVSEDGVISDMG